MRIRRRRAGAHACVHVEQHACVFLSVGLVCFSVVYADHVLTHRGSRAAPGESPKRVKAQPPYDCHLRLAPRPRWVQVRKAIKAAVASGALQPSVESAAKFWLGNDDAPAGRAAPGVGIEELSPGSGPGVEAGDAVEIAYELFLASGGPRVEAGKRFGFTVGGGDVIKGMDAGVLGLSVGGKRRVAVPWPLGYGKRGSGADIPPCADLVFKITLLSIKKGP